MNSQINQDETVLNKIIKEISDKFFVNKSLEKFLRKNEEEQKINIQHIIQKNANYLKVN